jgi:hypothetical protein
MASNDGRRQNAAIMKLLISTFLTKNVSRSDGTPPIVCRKITARAAKPEYVIEIVASAYR